MKRTKRQLAVAVARDVIKQVKARKFIAESGVYLGSVSTPWRSPSFVRRTGEELQKVLKKEQPECRVCALGSAFLSIVRLDDKFKLTRGHVIGIPSDDMRERLSKVFTYSELRDIEGVFEGHYDYNPYYPGFRALATLKDDKAVLIFIMKEIIRQKGRFNIKRAEAAAKIYANK